MNNEDFFSTIPKPILGLILALVGVIVLLGGIFRWGWLNMGRRTAWWTFIMGGVILIIGGLVLAVLNL